MTANTGATRTTGTTKTRLIAAAERLFAERGIDGVSLSEINRRSGARNVIALQYHFDGRDGLVRAILDKHRPTIDSRRHALPDQYEAGAVADLRLLAGAMVRPWAAMLAGTEGGPEFLQVSADLLNRPKPEIGPDPLEDTADSIHRWRALLDPLLEPDAVRLHRCFTAILHTVVELGRRARSGPHRDDRLFTSHLVDVATAILGAPVFTETRRLADERDSARS